MNDSALARAEQAIARAVQERADTLDLHGLGLKVVPRLPPTLNTVRRLDLSGNRLRTVPPEVWKFTRLESLDLGANRIASLDEGIGELGALQSLDLSENRLTTLPLALTACSHLEVLSLFANQFSTLPPVLLCLGALRQLHVARNRLDALPDLATLARLEVLDLAGNRLSAVPRGLAALPVLRVLDLSGNLLTSVDVTALPSSVEALHLDDNRLTQIPASLRTVAHLSSRGNPLTETHSIVDQPAVAPRTRSLRDMVTGGYEPGRRFFEAPDYHFGFALVLEDERAIADSLDLYYKTFDGTSISMRLSDGTAVDLSRVSRKAALDIAAPAKRVFLEFPPTSRPGVVDDCCEFVERTIRRVPHSTLIARVTDDGGGELPHKSAKTEAAVGTPDAGPASLPDTVPATARETAKSASSGPVGEPVDTAVFCPPQVARDSVFLVQVFLYPPRAAAEAAAQARQADDTAERRGTYSLPLDLPLGARVDLRLEMPTLSVLESDAVLIWRGTTTAAQFEVAVPRDVQASTAIGRIRLAVAGVPAGTLRFQVAVVAAGTSPNRVEARQLRARRYRRAFVSYSSTDRAEVLRRVQAFQIAGLSVFQDILELDPADRWEAALYREIDNCDVFLLFWSRAAAASPWVTKEIEYALARKHGDEDRPPDIQPVPIEGPPITPPPDRLSGLHFNDALLAHIRVADEGLATRQRSGPSGN